MVDALESAAMSFRLRVVLVCVLALMVPVQGIAALTSGVCLALGHHDGATHSQHGDHEGPESDQPPAGTAHCAPCVACCATAALTASAPIFYPDERADPVNVVSPPSLAGIQPETLDRPPLAR